MAILLTVKESTRQIVSGIPEYLTFTVNVPASVFYTLDGTDPDGSSEMVEGGVLYLPTNYLEFTFKAIAISGIESTDIFEQVYSQTPTTFTKRFAENDGISVLPVDSTPVEYLSYNQDNEEAQQTSIPFIDLEYKPSSRDVYKPFDGGKTAVDFINFTLELASIEEPYQSKTSSVNNNLEFDPNAGLILIDGSTEENMKSQVVKIINRPLGTLNTRSNFYNEHLQSSPPVFGNLVRYFVNQKTGKIVFYYHDSRECRWIESTQSINQKTLDLTNHLRNNYVFPWIEDPVMSKIF